MKDVREMFFFCSQITLNDRENNRASWRTIQNALSLSPIHFLTCSIHSMHTIATMSNLSCRIFLLAAETAMREHEG